VDDQIRGLYALATSGEHLPVNIGNPHEMTLLELAEAVIRVTGSKSEIVFEALPVDDPQVRQPDITRAQQVLGWEPEVELDEGLQKMLEADAGAEDPVFPGPDTHPRSSNRIAVRPVPRLEPIGVIGAGWVGLVTAACFARLGHEVVLHDVDGERIADLEAGRVPFHEPGLFELIAANRERLRFSTRAAEPFEHARLVFICVGTPAMYSGDADLSAVWNVVGGMADVAEGTVLVMKSTVPPGTGELVRARLDADGSGRVGYVSNPEFLAEGSAVADVISPDRVVVGSFRKSDGDRVAGLYEPLACPVLRVDVTSAEMIKYASNAFLATKISFINEIANVCEDVGANVRLVADGMGLDHRIGPHFLRAGVGYGGSCFPKDVAALKQLAGNSGYHFQLLSSVIEVNELQKRRVIGKLRKHLGELRGRKVALLGLAFKPDTNDVRESPSIVLAHRLLAEGAEVTAWDPVAVESARPLLNGVPLSADLIEVVRDTDAAILITEWDELKQLPRPEIHAAMRTPLIVDGRNFLDPNVVQAAGFAYEAIGRPSSTTNGRVTAAAADLAAALAPSAGRPRARR
jgi:UDPglucose 6-dehydrogenase